VIDLNRVRGTRFQTKIERQAAFFYLFRHAGDIKRLLRVVICAGEAVPLIA